MKKIIVLVLCLVMCLSFAACNAVDNNGKDYTKEISTDVADDSAIVIADYSAESIAAFKKFMSDEFGMPTNSDAAVLEFISALKKAKISQEKMLLLTTAVSAIKADYLVVTPNDSKAIFNLVKKSLNNVLEIVTPDELGKFMYEVAQISEEMVPGAATAATIGRDDYIIAFRMTIKLLTITLNDFDVKNFDVLASETLPTSKELVTLVKSIGGTYNKVVGSITTKEWTAIFDRIEKNMITVMGIPTNSQAAFKEGFADVRKIVPITLKLVGNIAVSIDEAALTIFTTSKDPLAIMGTVGTIVTASFNKLSAAEQTDLKALTVKAIDEFIKTGVSMGATAADDGFANVKADLWGLFSKISKLATDPADADGVAAMGDLAQFFQFCGEVNSILSPKQDPSLPEIGEFEVVVDAGAALLLK